MRRFTFALLLFFVAVAAAAQQQLTDAVIDQTVRDAVAAWHLPGLAIAVVQDDKVVFVRGYGVKDLDKPGAVTPDTLFELGSTTKAFTATALAMLADEKVLSWDDPVRKWVPGFRISDACTDTNITLRDIVSHRSGVARHDELWDYSDYGRAELIRRIGLMKTLAPLRTRYEYNNIMFVTAGEAAANAATTSWEDLIRTRIFAPLEMTGSRITFAEWLKAEHANGYHWDVASSRPVPQTMRNYDAIAPAGTIKSSARDMAQWLRFQLAGGAIGDKRLLSRDALEETREPQTIIPLGPGTRLLYPDQHFANYAMGWNVSDYHGQLLIAHGGALNGFRSNVALLPSRNFGIAILTNVGRGNALSAIRNTLIDRLLGTAPRDWNADLLASETFSIRKAESAKAARAAKRESAPPPSHELAAYAGTYRNAAFGDATIAVENGALVLRWQRVALPLVHENYDTFSAIYDPEEIDETVQFRLDAEGKIASFSLYGEEFARQ